jgi:hypothetical protein
MSTTKHQGSKVTRSVEVTVDHRPLVSTLHKGLVVYRAVLSENIAYDVYGSRRPRKGESSTQTLTGISPIKIVKELLSGERITIAPYYPKRGEGTSSLLAVKPAFLEVVREIGYYAESGTDPYKGLTVHDPLTALENGEEIVFVEQHGYAHELYDIDGEPLPVCLAFDYINGGFANDRYDLRRAAEILLKRSDVTLSPNAGERSYRRDEDPKDPATYVGDIPYYNKGRGRSQCLSFQWHPTVEDYRKVFAAQQPGRWSDKRRACFDVDIFGLRAGGAAKFSDYDQSERDSHSADDDDSEET